MGKCIVIVGPMGSEKTDLAKYLEREGYQRIVTYTTRPMRDGEIDGLDYHFITEEEFKEKIVFGFFAEYMHRKGSTGEHWYGSAKQDYNLPGRRVIVLDPYGVMCLTEAAYVVWLNTPERIRLERIIRRGCSALDVVVRFEEDKEDFKRLQESLLYDMEITEEEPLEKMALDITEQVEAYNIRLL